MIGGGLELETGGHVFTIMLTNASGLMENDFLVNTLDSWSKGNEIQFHLARFRVEEIIRDSTFRNGKLFQTVFLTARKLLTFAACRTPFEPDRFAERQPGLCRLCRVSATDSLVRISRPRRSRPARRSSICTVTTRCSRPITDRSTVSMFRRIGCFQSCC